MSWKKSSSNATTTVSVQSTGDHTGDVGVVISGVTGPVITGSGSINITTVAGSSNTSRGSRRSEPSSRGRSGGENVFTGNGVTVINGDNPDGVRNRRSSGR